MVGLRWVFLTALLPLLGTYARAWRGVRALPFVARVTVYFGTGLLTVGTEMFLLSAFGLYWSAWSLLPIPLALSMVAWWRFRPVDGTEARPRAIAALAILAVAVFGSTAFSAAVTSGDYVLFWGVKGQRFGAERILDTAFMTQPNHYMTPDYPPLVPLYYAWTMLGGDAAMDWWGGIAAAPLFLLLAVMAVWGFGKYARIPAADAVTALFASLFALLYIRHTLAGNAEPMLHFFAALALGALIAQRRDELDPVASVALAGAAMTKVEGGVFALLVIAFSWPARSGSWKERLLAGAKLAVLPCAALAAWLGFVQWRGLTDHYVPGGGLSLAYLAPTLSAMTKELAMNLAYAPWIACAVLLGLAPARRNALPWLAAAAAFLLFLVVIAMRPNPHLEWTAGRTLLIPLLLSVFAVLTAWRERGK